MSFKENINRICLERGTNLTAVVKQVKGSSSFTSSINKGSLPKEDEMVQMAKILNCSVIDFFMDEEDLAPPNSANPNTLFFIKHCFGFVVNIEEVG